MFLDNPVQHFPNEVFLKRFEKSLGGSDSLALSAASALEIVEGVGGLVE